MTEVKWGFIFNTVQNYMEHFAMHWRDEDVHLWKNEPGYVSIEYTFASPHFNSARDMYDLKDRATALKAVFDGAEMLDVLPEGRFVPFALGQIVEVTTLRRHDGPSEGNVLVEPFDGKVFPPKPQTKLIRHDRYGAEDMLLQARYDFVAKGLLKHLGHNGPDFRTLYSLLDWMESEGWTEAQVAAVTGRKAADINVFTGTANNETVLGPLARHGDKRWKAPAAPMRLEDAKALILPAAKSFLRSRAEAYDANGEWPKFIRPPKSKKKGS